jgi:hypothetical protein
LFHDRRFASFTQLHILGIAPWSAMLGFDRSASFI